LFEEHGNVVEVALIRDKRTGIQQGCCFIKYASSEEAERAIRSLHNHHTLPGGMGPIQVRFADGERERVVEYKLFVGSLNKQATEKEVEEIFSPYGRVEDVYLMRDEMKQSRGCGFVKYAQREMAMAAINSLNGIFVMRGCEQALSVRFADPKRPRAGEPRGGAGGTTFGGPGSGPRFQSPGAGSTPNYGEPVRGNTQSNAWQPMSPHKVGPTSNADMQAFGNQMRPPRSNDMPSTMGGPYGGPTGSADGSLTKPVIPSSMPQQNYNQSSQQGLTPQVGQQISPVMKPTQSPQQFPSMQLQQQSQSQTTNPSSYISQPQIQTQNSGGQLGQAQVPNSGAGQMPYPQMYPSQQMVGLSGQVSGPQQTAPYVNNNNLPLQNVGSTLTNQQQPVQQSPSQLAQMLSQQTQSLQASFQSSQQAFSQLQQQLQLMQPPNQTTSQNPQPLKQQQQPQWIGMVAQTGVNPTLGDATPAATPVKCSWTEHTSPDGYKYYYNSTSGESKWEKPEELILLEKQQQQVQPQQQQVQLQQQQIQPQQHQVQPQQQQVQPQQQKIITVQQQPQQIQSQQPQNNNTNNNINPQMLQMLRNPQFQQQYHLQAQTQTQTQTYPQQFQQQQAVPHSSMFQVQGITPAQQSNREMVYNNAQIPVAGGGTGNIVKNPAAAQFRQPQGYQGTNQEWAWKNKPAGS
jgi:CUG-BP- and ETR3-like factor